VQAQRSGEIMSRRVPVEAPIAVRHDGHGLSPK
jgi:hypothetical protein